MQQSHINLKLYVYSNICNIYIYIIIYLFFPCRPIFGTINVNLALLIGVMFPIVSVGQDQVYKGLLQKKLV